MTDPPAVMPAQMRLNAAREALARLITAKPRFRDGQVVATFLADLEAAGALSALEQADTLDGSMERHPAGKERAVMLTEARSKVHRCALIRHEDVSGISGTGVVAYGVQFPDGTLVLRWDTKVRSTTVYDSLEDLIEITGHGGRTTVELLDEMDELIPRSSVPGANLPDESAVAAGYAQGGVKRIAGRLTVPADAFGHPRLAAVPDQKIGRVERCADCPEPITQATLDPDLPDSELIWVHASTGLQASGPMANRHKARPAE